MKGLDSAGGESYNQSYKLYFTHKEAERMPKPKDKYAWTVTVGEKGQFVIPKQARELFDIRPGDSLVLLADKQRGLAIPPKRYFSELMQRVFEEES